MIRMFFNRFLLSIIICLSAMTTFSLDFDKYQNSLDAFLLLEQDGGLYTAKGMEQLFLTFNEPVSKVIKELSSQIRDCKKRVKKTKDFDVQCQLKELECLLSFIKKHKIQYEAILFQHDMRIRYQKLFDMVESNQDVIAFIVKNLGTYKLDFCNKRYLYAFVKDLRQASHRVSYFEDYLHGDDVDLKLQNYVFKIELIKLRNAILFDERYKQQK